MYCPNCGTQCNDRDLFCGECGTSLKEYWEEETVQEIQVQEELQPEVQGVMPEKKPVSKSKMILIAEIVLMAVLIGGIYSSLNKRFSPENVVENYWKAAREGRWGTAYEYCSFPKDDMLTKQMYVNAHANSEKKQAYKAMKVVKENLTSPKSDIQSYFVEYIVEGSSEKSHDYVTVTKGKKKFLFWNDWEIAPEGAVAADTEITVPENAQLKLNGKEMDMDNGKKEDGVNHVIIPYLFAGEYQMEVEAEGMEPYKTYVYVDMTGVSPNYISLIPSAETKQEIAQQFGEDLKAVLEGAAAGKGFAEMKEYFASAEVKKGYLESEYEELLRLNEKDSRIISFDISDIEVTVESGYSNVNVVSLTVEYVVNGQYRSYRDSVKSNEFDVEKYITYRLEDGNWKLTDMPISYYNLW